MLFASMQQVHCSTQQGWCACLLLKGRHAGHEEERGELDGALHVEVRLRQRLQEFPEGGLEEGVVLLLVHLRRAIKKQLVPRVLSSPNELNVTLQAGFAKPHGQ